MRFFNGWRNLTKGPLGTSSLETWADYIQESCQIGGMRIPLGGYSPAPIGQPSPTPRISIACFIYWMLFLAGLVSAYILLTSWETPGRGSVASSMAVSPSERNWDILMARRPFCCQPLPSGESNPYFLEDRSSLKFETSEEEILLWKS